MKLLAHTYILLSLVAIMVIIPLAKISGTKDTSTSITASENIRENLFVITDTSVAEGTPGAYYSESDNSWSFSAHVLEIKDVSIYGRRGSIAKIEFLDRGEPSQAWAVLTIDDYSFSDSNGDITVGDQISLQVSGDYVSRNGVDWGACPRTDLYCQHAGFIEGGFPVSEDFGGLTISPSNTLIHWGSGPSDWINGMLAWKILLSED
jgi:hypothetical protein